jgi:hypothetical protein
MPEVTFVSPHGPNLNYRSESGNGQTLASEDVRVNVNSGKYLNFYWPMPPEEAQRRGVPRRFVGQWHVCISADVIREAIAHGLKIGDEQNEARAIEDACNYTLCLASLSIAQDAMEQNGGAPDLKKQIGALVTWLQGKRAECERVMMGGAR